MDRGTRTWELGHLRLHRTVRLPKPTAGGFLRRAHVHRGLLAHGQGGESADHQDAQANPEHHLEETEALEQERSAIGARGGGGRWGRRARRERGLRRVGPLAETKVCS